MNVTLSASAILILCLVVTAAMAGEFRREDEPGYRQSIGNEDSPQTQEQMDFLNCSLRENLRSEFVEACAIFKEVGRRHLECRYFPGTYEDVPRVEIIKQREAVVNTCAETLSNSRSGNAFTQFWSKLFGE